MENFTPAGEQRSYPPFHLNVLMLLRSAILFATCSESMFKSLSPVALATKVAAIGTKPADAGDKNPLLA